MNTKTQTGIRGAPGLTGLGLGLTLLAAPAVEAAVNVRVQPSGDTLSGAYVLKDEAREYFGNVEGAGAYECQWTFSDGTPATGYSAPGNPHFISIAHTFSSAGNHFLTLSCQDPGNPADHDSATIQVAVQAVDSDLRKRNSAIDRGLRYAYQQQNTGTGCFSGQESDVASTGMALLAIENHGHNLESDDEDIYKPIVKSGLRCLFDRAEVLDLTSQSCIGDPEDGDNDGKNADGSANTEHDGKGIRFGGQGQYYGPFAVLAIVNAGGNVTANTYLADGGPAGVNGMSLRDIVVDAKDYLAWSQTDNGPNGGGGNPWCDSPNGYYETQVSGATADLYYGYEWLGVDCTALSPMPAYTIDWGDGSSVVTVPGLCDGGSWGGDYNWLGSNFGNPVPPHTYAAAGTYNLSVSMDGNLLCTMQVTTGGNCGNNGWRYNENDSSIDNSVTQWPSLALFEAEKNWGIAVKPEVKTEVGGWLAYSQGVSGAFGYDAPNSWDNLAKTGAGLIMLDWLAKPLTDPAAVSALAYLGTQYNNTYNVGGGCPVGNNGCNKGNYYAMYAFYKAMKLYGLHTLDVSGSPVDWEKDYHDYLVARQNAYPSNDWPGDQDWIWNTQMASYFAVAMLAPEVAGLPPVAVAGGPYGPVNANQAVTLNGSLSFHQDPAKAIAKYEWDFDAADGLWWDTKPAPAANEGAVGATVNDPGYPDTGSDHSYTVTLRVTDNGPSLAPPQTAMTDTDTSTVRVTSGNVPPVAKTNGPWASLPGQDVVFDGSASSDPNAGPPLNDHIVSYEWDFGDGTTATGAVVHKSFADPVSKLVTLCVTDSFGLRSCTQSQYLAVALAFATDYRTCWSARESRFLERRGLAVTFTNTGSGEVENLVVTLTNTPSNLTVVSGSASLGNLAAGASAATACNTSAKTADIVVRADSRIAPSGDWAWKAEFEYNGQHYIIPNLPPLVH